MPGVWGAMAATIDGRNYWRAQWRALKGGTPGHRFQDHYVATRRAARPGRWGVRLLTIAAAVCCLAIGLVLAVMPGPAVLFFFLAGALLATESRRVARLMDWAEVRGRRAYRVLERRWRGLPRGARGLILATLGAAAGLALYLGWSWWRG